MQTVVNCRCPMCGQISYILCDEEAWNTYEGGALAQEAFADMDPFTCETIISGMCIPCQDRFFIEDEEEDDSIPCNGVCDLCNEGDTCPWSNLS